MESGGASQSGSSRKAAEAVAARAEREKVPKLTESNSNFIKGLMEMGDQDTLDRNEKDDSQRSEKTSEDESSSYSSSDSSDGSSEDESEEEDSWIYWYCSLKGNEFFAEVDPDYIDDSFNLHGLADKFPYFSPALDIIMDIDLLDEDYPPDSDLRLDIEQTSEVLYGMIHARYILTAHGLSDMGDKFQSHEFGECLKIDCERQALLPIGLSDIPGEHTVKTYCCRCCEIYLPAKERNRSVDGAFWGRTFPHLFLLMHPIHIERGPTLPPNEPRIYGFKVHKSSPYWGEQAVPVLQDGLQSGEKVENIDEDEDKRKKQDNPGENVQKTSAVPVFAAVDRENGQDLPKDSSVKKAPSTAPLPGEKEGSLEDISAGVTKLEINDEKAPVACATSPPSPGNSTKRA